MIEIVFINWMICWVIACVYYGGNIITDSTFWKQLSKEQLNHSPIIKLVVVLVMICSFLFFFWWVFALKDILSWIVEKIFPDPPPPPSC